MYIVLVYHAIHLKMATMVIFCVFYHNKKNKRGEKREEAANDLNMPQRDNWNDQLCSTDSKKNSTSAWSSIMHQGVLVLAALSFHVPGTQCFGVTIPKVGRTGRP